MTLRRTPSMRFAGTLGREGGDATMQVESKHRAEGAIVDSGEPVGYTMVDGGTVVGAVETINRGRVWIDPSLSERDRMRAAAMAAALLLFDPAD